MNAKMENSFPVDDLVKALGDEQGQIEKTLLVGGFMGGRNEETGKVRFFLEPTLSVWLELSPNYIVHSLKLKTTQSPVGGTLIWLSSDTPYSERLLKPKNIPLLFLG